MAFVIRTDRPLSDVPWLSYREISKRALLSISSYNVIILRGFSAYCDPDQCNLPFRPLYTVV